MFWSMKLQSKLWTDLLWTIFIMLVVGCTHADNDISPKEPVKVGVTVVQAKNGQAVFRYSGTVQEGAATAVSFSMPGTVKSVKVSDGSKVKKGAVVATLDDTAAKNALEIAAAMKSQAEDARTRLEKLYKNKSISEIQWMEVESKYRQAVASEKLAQKNLDDCILYAPASGIVSGKNIEVGQNVAPNVPVLKIVGLSKVKIVAQVPEKEIGEIHIGDKVELSVGALGNRTFMGKVSNKGILANVLSRSYEIEAELENGSGDLLPGMIAEMKITRSDSTEHFSLSTAAVLLDERNRQFVWVVKGGKAQRKDVETRLLTGASGNEIWVQGVSAGDTVIVSGIQKIGQGSQVTIK